MTTTHEDRAGSPGEYQDQGWEHWPEDPWFSYQFRRALGEAQEGGGAISEVFQTAEKIRPHDNESWYAAWLGVAERARDYAQAAKDAGNTQTARAAWLRASNYFRSAEFMLGAKDPRRLPTYDQGERSFQSAAALFDPPIEVVAVPFEGKQLHGYFMKPAYGEAPWPVVIAFGGLDSFKEEVYFMVAKGLAERGVACFFMDGPGQGATLRREQLYARHDYEVPVGAVIDYLEQRGDVDASRIGVSGTSLGGYYATRVACCEPRIAAAVSHGAEWDIGAEVKAENPESGAAEHFRFILGVDSWDEVLRRFEPFALAPVIAQMTCPYLIVHGVHDFFGDEQADLAYEGIKAAGVDAELRLVTPEETGADHCQHDNPTLGLEIIGDWFAKKLGAPAEVDV
jgi:dienelactone hydrolase